jgi:hypothetical protein
LTGVRNGIKTQGFSFFCICNFLSSPYHHHNHHHYRLTTPANLASALSSFDTLLNFDLVSAQLIHSRGSLGSVFSALQHPGAVPDRDPKRHITLIIHFLHNITINKIRNNNLEAQAWQDSDLAVE